MTACPPPLSRALLRAAATAALLAALLGPARARADEVKLVRRPVFRNVQVTDYRDGRLHFRGVSRQTLRKPIAEVEWIRIDGWPELNLAERPPDPDMPTAPQYELLIRQTAEPWQIDLLRIRHAQALDRERPLNEALPAYLKLLADRVPGAAAARPRHPDPAGSAGHAAARARLRTARSLGQYRTFQQDLLLLELELLLWDQVSPLPRPFSQWARTPAEQTPPAPEPEAESDAPPAMFADVPLVVEGAPRLPPDSFVYQAIDEALDLDDRPAARAWIERVTPFAAEDDPGLALRVARLALAESPGDAVPLLETLRESNADLPSGALATYYVGLAFQRLERPAAAEDAWRALLRHRGADERLRAFARARLGLSAPTREQP